MVVTGVAPDRARILLGDWQTPRGLARDVVALLANTSDTPASVLEPTCGDGVFLCAAVEQYPKAKAVGFDIAESHLEVARSLLAKTNATLTCADFFSVDWDEVVARLPQPIFVLGNPPWVTNAAVGALSGSNLPAKSNFKQDRGIEARTGKGNFDISEWMLMRLLRALQGKRFTMAMLCKARVARQILQHVSESKITGAIHEFDAKAHFDATVDAVLLILRSSETAKGAWPVYASLNSQTHTRMLGLVNGQLVNDVAAASETAHLEGDSDLVWRSGVKHDCAAVMEWSQVDGVWRNGLGKTHPLWNEGRLYPLCKGSHVAARRGPLHRVLVTQTRLGEDTQLLQQTAPATWAYLQQHAEAMAARKSRIYSGQPPFAMFGVGAYSFAPYKVAICGLYKRLVFHLLGPHEDRPVMVDDTCYFLPCDSRAQAEALSCALNGELAQKFFKARVFWDSKRPITKALLASLSLSRLLAQA